MFGEHRCLSHGGDDESTRATRFQENSQEAQVLGEVKPFLKLGHSLHFHYRTCKFLNSRPLLALCRPQHFTVPLAGLAPPFSITPTFQIHREVPWQGCVPFPASSVPAPGCNRPGSLAGGACPCPPAVAEDHCMVRAEVMSAGFTEPQQLSRGHRFPLRWD